MPNSALLLIDLQNDFCPGGSLEVPEGDLVIPIANEWMTNQRFTKVIASQDWHPQNHKSFASNHPGHEIGETIEVEGLSQILWPDHCVQNSAGAQFHPSLNVKKVNKVIQKGTNPLFDSYSAFFDNGHRHKTDLDLYLQSYEIQELFIMGLATDYCVLYTVLDARRLGYNVYLIEDGCRGVNLDPDDSERALRLMRTKGAHLI